MREIVYHIELNTFLYVLLDCFEIWHWMHTEREKTTTVGEEFLKVCKGAFPQVILRHIACKICLILQDYFLWGHVGHFYFHLAIFVIYGIDF